MNEDLPEAYDMLRLLTGWENPGGGGGVGVGIPNEMNGIELESVTMWRNSI